MKTQAKTSAERMREYRARQREAGQKTSSFLIDGDNAEKLEAYAAKHGLSQTAALNELLKDKISVTCDNAEITRLRIENTDLNIRLTDAKEEATFWSEKSLESEGFYAESKKRIEKLQNELKNALERHITPENKLCQFVTGNDMLCKNKATSLIEINGFSVYCCDRHNKKGSSR
jgi:DNA polymerase II small subunit/DNA polymerase delta subunit B